MEIELEQEAKYMRLIGGKIVYVTASEAAEEEVLARPRVLTDQDIVVFEWNDRVKRVEQLKERISLVHQMVRDDEQRPSQYEPDYNTLWDQYRHVIGGLREIDSEPVSQFRDKVIARVGELPVRLNAVCGNGDIEDFEQMLALFEKLHDQALALR